MPRCPRRLAGLLLLGIAFTLLSACAEDTDNLPSTGGVEDTEILPVGRAEPEGISDVGSETVDVVFAVGSCGGPGDAPLLPYRVAVEYGENEITIMIDTTLDCGSVDVEGVAFIRAMRLHLTEETGGREVVLVESAAPDQ
jgi:hypothetical protein